MYNKGNSYYKCSLPTRILENVASTHSYQCYPHTSSKIPVYNILDIDSVIVPIDMLKNEWKKFLEIKKNFLDSEYFQI